MSEVVEETRAPRERKQVQRMEVTVATPKDKTLSIPEGSGVVLGEYEYFVEGLKKLKSDDDTCKNLHTLMFGGPGQNTQRKANLRKFNGFADDVNLVTKRDKLITKKSLTVSDLKVFRICCMSYFWTLTIYPYYISISIGCFVPSGL